MTIRRAGASMVLAIAVAAAAGGFARAQRRAAPPLHVRSTPENVVANWFPIDRTPVLRVASGTLVRMDTLSQRGAMQAQDPVEFLGAYGVKPNEVLQDVRDFWASRNRRPPEERGGHILTGPIYIEGAEPGDTLAVEVVELTTRVPYGINTTGATTGVFASTYAGQPGDRLPDISGTVVHLIRTGVVNGRPVALFADNIQVPLRPFMGTMAVAPAAPTVGQPGVSTAGVQTSGPPGAYGGNMDFKELGVGATLYLPVFHRGALFYAGDPHGVQGDGEISGNALEQSLTGVFRFTVLKGKTIGGPRAETATHYFLMGIDGDLDRATRLASLEAIDFLVKEKGLSPAKAFSLCSIGVDFHLAEAVDGTQVVVAKIPKPLFLH